MFREKCAGTVKAKPGEEELLEAFWKANYYVAGTYDLKMWVTKLYRQGSGRSGMFIHSGSQIQKQQQKRRGRRYFWPAFFVATNITKLKLYLIVELVKKKIWTNLQWIIELFTPKIVIKFSKILFGVRDPGSGKDILRIPDPGVKKAPDPGSWSATLFTRKPQWLISSARMQVMFTVPVSCCGSGSFLCVNCQSKSYGTVSGCGPESFLQIWTPNT